MRIRLLGLNSVFNGFELKYKRRGAQILFQLDLVHGAEQESAGNLPKDHDAEGDVIQILDEWLPIIIPF